MEGISGLELARQIRRLDPDALLCFVSTSDDFYREAYNLYIFQYLVKPISQTQIHELLQRAQMQIQLPAPIRSFLKRGENPLLCRIIS